ncbi:hypothetical protein FF2_000396 [Malus domestica]
MAMSATTTSTPNYWITDSGASYLVTPDPSFFNSAIPYTGSEQLLVGDGKGQCISHIGHTFTCTLTAVFHLNDVLLVPQASHNLLSMYKFVYDNWCSLTFDPFGFYIKDLRTGKVLLQGLSEDGLYPFYCTTSNGFSRIIVSPRALMVAKADIHLWHRRLRNPSSAVLHYVLRNNHLHVLGLVNKLQVCVACQMGKASKLPFSMLPCNLVKQFHLVHADVWGPSPTSSCTSYKYYLILVDDFTKYSWLYPLYLKSDVASILQTFILKVKTLFASKVQCLRSDSGGEFLNKTLQSFFNAQGITYQLSCPHTPEQNGCAERKYRHVVEMGRTLLSQSDLPSKFWVEAFQTLMYLINRLPSQTSSLSLWEQLFQAPPK